MSTKLFPNWNEIDLDEEVIYLASGNIGPKGQWLATLPVTITDLPRGRFIVLPEQDPSSGEVTVTVLSNSLARKHKKGHRFDLDIPCEIVASTNPLRPVSSREVAVSLSEIRRGRMPFSEQVQNQFNRLLRNR